MFVRELALELIGSCLSNFKINQPWPMFQIFYMNFENQSEATCFTNYKICGYECIFRLKLKQLISPKKTTAAFSKYISLLKILVDLCNQ